MRGVRNCGFLLLLLAVAGCVSDAVSPQSLRSVSDWFILLNYDGAARPVAREEILTYDLAILDPDTHPDLEPLKGHVTLIAYVSLGEAETYRFYWETVKDRPWVLEENPNWGGNHYVDIRSPEWQDLLVREVVPRIKAQGFDGLFLDTVDTAAFLESRDAKRFAGSRQAMIQLVKRLHEAFPDLLLIPNNGFEVLEAIAPVVQGVVTESLCSMPDFEAGGYRTSDPEDRGFREAALHKMMKRYGLAVFNIDYVAPGDLPMAHECVKDAHQNGFKPFVTQKDLDRLPAFRI